MVILILLKINWWSCNVGFDAVKFQKEQLILFTQKKYWLARESPWGSTQREQKEGLEFELDEYDEIDKYCKKKNIWFASAWDTESLKFLDKYNLNYNKIASAMITDLNFLEEVAKEKSILLFLPECLLQKYWWCGQNIFK